MAKSPDFRETSPENSDKRPVKTVHPRWSTMGKIVGGLSALLVAACVIPQRVEAPFDSSDGGFITLKPVVVTPASVPYKDLSRLADSRVPSLESLGSECVSDGVSQLIYQTVEGNLVRQPSDLEVNIECDGYPSRSLSGLDLDCNGVTVEDARVVTWTYRGSLFVVDSGGRIRLTARVTPSTAPITITWKTPHSINLPNGGTFEYPDAGRYNVVDYIAPINAGNQAEGVTLRGDLSQNPWTFCPNVDLAILPLP